MGREIFNLLNSSFRPKRPDINPKNSSQSNFAISDFEQNIHI
jgi:hypothetical protein